MAFIALFVLGVVMAPTVLGGGNDSCYGSLGCFSNKSPWCQPLRLVPAPESPESIDAKFYLHTRNAPNRFVINHPSDGVWDASGSDFDGSRKTIFVIHGFTQVGNETAINSIRDALLYKVDANVIVVDWGKGAAGLLNYLQVVSNTRVVAATIAQLFRYLKAQLGADESRLHLVGHSLGAQIAGYVGKAVPNVARITALDAAQPLFELHVPEVRLAKTDALFVDAIHTDGKLTFPSLGAGLVNPVGHVDFFVNGGWNQPGCITKLWPNVTSFADFIIQPAVAIYIYVRCPHDRAVELFVASLVVQNCTFWGHKLSATSRAISSTTGGLMPKIAGTTCAATTCSAMGYDAINYPGRGSFDVYTKSPYPFCSYEPQANTFMASVYTPS